MNIFLIGELGLALLAIGSGVGAWSQQLLTIIGLLHKTNRAKSHGFNRHCDVGTAGDHDDWYVYFRPPAASEADRYR